MSGSLVPATDPAGCPVPPRPPVSPPAPPIPAAGNCWLRQARNGRCQVLYKTDLSKEECCKTGRLTTSWTEEDVNDNTLFKWMIFNGGAPNCIPCKGEGGAGELLPAEERSRQGLGWGRRSGQGAGGGRHGPAASFLGATLRGVSYQPRDPCGDPISARPPCTSGGRRGETSSAPCPRWRGEFPSSGVSWRGGKVLSLCALGSQCLFFL